MRSLGSRAISVVTCVTLVAGCYSYTAIKPTELPKLSGPSFGQVTDGPNAGQAVAVAVRQVETPDGKLVEIHGEFDVVITTAGREWTFEYPIAAALTAGMLEVKSKNYAPVKLDPRAIQSAQIKQHDGAKAKLAIAGLFLTGVLVMVALI